MYRALYRKYRPLNFSSVVGQNSIVKTLKNSIIKNNFTVQPGSKLRIN